MHNTGYRLRSSRDTQYLTTSTPPATIRATPSAFRTLKLAPAPKKPRASSSRLARSWDAITSERARDPALRRRDGDGSDYDRAEDSRSHGVPYRAARELGPGHNQRDRKRERAGREAGERHHHGWTEYPLGRSGKVGLHRHAHAGQYSEDDRGFHKAP